MDKIITLTPQNVENEHICCAFADKKCAEGYQSKKQWLMHRLADGYVFKKLDVRGKVFIEYVPAENAWAPVDAPGYMMIHCFWVSGQFKGKGYGKMLYDECEKEALTKGMNGIVVVSSAKKQPFLSEKKFFTAQGFTVADTAEPYFELLYKPLKTDAPLPQIKSCAKDGICDNKEGLTVYYTDACPFNAYYVAVLEVIAAEKGYKIRAIKIETKEQAQNHFVPYVNYGVFKNGKFITQCVLNESFFHKYIK